MKSFKIILTISLIIFLSIILFTSVNKYLSWPIRFEKEFNSFFGEGNWKYVSEEEKESIIYSVYRSSRNLPYNSEVPGKYKNWYIEYNDELWTVTNHAYKINNDKYFILSDKRLSNKQALGIELMDISFQIIGESIIDEYLDDLLSEKEIECLRVEISYSGGNPKPDFYDYLFREPWFNVSDIKAENYLSIKDYNFFIDIFTYDYKLEKLSESEVKNMRDSFIQIEEILLGEYGDNASFEIYLNDEYSVKYKHGVKIDENE